MEAHVDAVLAQRLHLFALGEVVQVDAHLGAQRVELPHEARYDVEHARAEDADLQVARQARAAAEGALARQPRQLQDVGHVLQQRLCRLRQLHAMRRAQEQGRTQLLLDLPDLARQRRLGHVQPFGGAAEIALLRHREKVAHLPQVHRLLL